MARPAQDLLMLRHQQCLVSIHVTLFLTTTSFLLPNHAFARYSDSFRELPRYFDAGADVACDCLRPRSACEARRLPDASRRWCMVAR
jgi:hypothetical protein